MAEELTESGGRLPQPTEEVHLPDPSYLPVLVAVGMALVVMGAAISFLMAGVGLLIALVATVRWIRSTRRDMRQLPMEH